MDAIYSPTPQVLFLDNIFITPTLLRYENVPLINVAQVADASFTTVFSIFHPDGTPLAKVKGTQLYLTEQGKKAGLRLRHKSGVTACELNGQTLFEVRREGAAALHLTAELYAPDGAFIRTVNSDLATKVMDGVQETLQRHNIFITNNFFQVPVGVQVWKDGSVNMGGIMLPSMSA
jgi:hypothetical protein